MQRTFGWVLGNDDRGKCDCPDDPRARGNHLAAAARRSGHPGDRRLLRHKITDNYRWLEDAKSPATRAFIEAQNAYTAQYMKQVRIRPQAVEGLTALENIAVTTAPFERANNYFFARRLAGEQQFSIYVRHGWKGKEDRLIDPEKLSSDPNSSVFATDVSRDGTLLAYGVRIGGADETTIHILNVKTGQTLPDELPKARYFGAGFAPDGASLYYARNDKDGTLLYQHVLGTPVSADTLIFGHEFHGEPLAGNDLFSGVVTDDGHYLMVTISRGVPPRRVDIVFRDLTKPDSPFQVLVWGVDSRFSAIYAKDAWYVQTDYKAPNGRILKAIPGAPPDAWKTIVPEGPDVLDTWSIVGGKLYVNRLKDVKSETTVYALDGTPAGKIDYDGIGSASGVSGLTTDRYGYFSFESFIVPWTIYRLDTRTGKREVFFQPKIPFDSSQYELKQVFFKSKDGTQVPMFIAGKKGLKQDGTERLLMTGYGGFNISNTPDWNPRYAWWLEQGGWFALPNLRGGGEYGENWHEQGMFERKQNVFDDWFAAAEYLIANKYTSPQHFAITGRSNGGLLMGASITQRPELFSAVWCGYPLLDMLRFQKFLVGGYWTTEYGSAENEKQFPYLLKVFSLPKCKSGRRLPGGNVLHRRQRYARRPTACAQNDGPVAIRQHQRPAHPAALQPARRTQRRRGRKPAGPGRCRPAYFPLD
jgi:prolyl oligopeptidase